MCNRFTIIVNDFLLCIAGNSKPQHMLMLIHINPVRYLILYWTYRINTRIGVYCTGSVRAMTNHCRNNFQKHSVLPAIPDHKVVILTPVKFLIPKNLFCTWSSHYKRRSLRSISCGKQKNNHCFTFIYCIGSKPRIRFPPKNQAT